MWFLGKSVNIPTNFTAAIYLGLVLNTRNLKFIIPEVKVQNFLVTVSSVKANEVMIKSDLASIVGTLMSFARALGPIVRHNDRAIYECWHQPGGMGLYHYNF